MRIIEQITDNPVKLDSEFTLSKLIGKQVISMSGDIVGKVRDIIIHNYAIIGIIVSKRMRPDLYIDRKHFDSFREDAVVLKIDPVMIIVGLPVVDKNGRKIGKVSRIERGDTKNSFNALFLKRRIYQKEIRIKSSDIKAVSQHVILAIDIE